MGSGKTTYAINKMNTDTENNYIYITPFLDEVKRIKENCTGRKFYDPLNIGKGKLDSLHNLLKDGKNIATTHALFRMSTDVTRELIRANDYILILDEVCDVIEQIPLKKNDLEAILEHATIENNFLIWTNLDYEGRYNDIKIMALNNSIMYANNCLLMWNFPVSVFKSFKECYIMTYLFDAQIQKYYYDLHNAEYEYIDISPQKINKKQIKEKIHILDDSINKIGEDYYALSVTWYNKDKNKPLISKLKNNISNYFRNKIKAKSDKIMWTCFKDNKKNLSGAGYTKGFVACNARATNNYRDKNCLAYCVNIFLNPIIKNFFIEKEVEVLEEKYALSEILQWIWRSCIREHKDISIYIPSSRMRNILMDWLDQEE